MKTNPYADNLVVDCYFLEGYYPRYYKDNPFKDVPELSEEITQLGKGDKFHESSEDKEYLEQKSYDLNLLSPKLYVRYDSGREDKIELNMTPKVAKEKLYKVRELLTELVSLGESYAHFQSAQYTHKNLKKSLKSLTNIS
tara:strand:- start:1016 stop:1435 length:420 start_codon:yes stop_codon:yes gene_type:complete